MATRVEVNRVADLPQSLREEILCTTQTAFSTGAYNLEWVAEGEWQVTVWEDETWVSVQQIFERTVYVRGRPVPVAGLGNLITLPEWRNHGYGTRAYIAAMAFIVQNVACQYGMMFCIHQRTPILGMLGWQMITGPVTCLQASGQRTFNGDIHTLVCCLGEKPWPRGPVELRGLPW